jgi:hypothetical protein
VSLFAHPPRRACAVRSVRSPQAHGLALRRRVVAVGGGAAAHGAAAAAHVAAAAAAAAAAHAARRAAAAHAARGAAGGRRARRHHRGGGHIATAAAAARRAAAARAARAAAGGRYVYITRDGRTRIKAITLLLFEDQPSFACVLRWYKEAFGSHPLTLITDGDYALHLAITEVIGPYFAAWCHILCVWHVAQLVAKHVKHLFGAAVAGRRGGPSSDARWNRYISKRCLALPLPSTRACI